MRVVARPRTANSASGRRNSFTKYRRSHRWTGSSSQRPSRCAAFLDEHHAADEKAVTAQRNRRQHPVAAGAPEVAVTNISTPHQSVIDISTSGPAKRRVTSIAPRVADHGEASAGSPRKGPDALDASRARSCRSWAPRKCCKSQALAPTSHHGQASVKPNGRRRRSRRDRRRQKKGSG